jgi:hypothetical protein
MEELLMDFGASTTATTGGGVGAKKRAARQCDVCEDDIATRHCGDCKKNSFFCDDCFEVSHKKAKNVSHQSTTVEERLIVVGPETAQVSLALCKVHREPLKLYCDDCDKVACLECGMFGATHTQCFFFGGCTCKFERVHVRECLRWRVLFCSRNTTCGRIRCTFAIDHFISTLMLNEHFSVVDVVVQAMRVMRFRCWTLLIAPSAKRSVKVSLKQSK